MTVEELELDPSFTVISNRPTEEPSIRLALPPAPSYAQQIDEMWVGKWKCKACKVWVDGPSRGLCKWCEEHKEEIEYIRGEIVTDDKLPNHIFKMVSPTTGLTVFATITEEGRVVELENY